MNALGKVGLVLISVLSITGCALEVQSPVQATTVTGSVTYRERIALPPSSVVKVRLVDVSRADAPAIVIGEQVIKTAGRQVPFSFEIAYDPKRIDERFTYAVQARIEDEDGRLRFISDRHYPVLTRGAGRHVDLVLSAVAAPAPK
jgi:putative lipoprotein